VIFSAGLGLELMAPSEYFGIRRTRKARAVIENGDSV